MNDHGSPSHVCTDGCMGYVRERVLERVTGYPQLEALEKRVDELEKRLRILESNRPNPRTPRKW